MGKSYVLKKSKKRESNLSKTEAQKIAAKIREEIKTNGRVNTKTINKFMFG